MTKKQMEIYYDYDKIHEWDKTFYELHGVRYPSKEARM